MGIHLLFQTTRRGPTCTVCLVVLYTHSHTNSNLSFLNKADLLTEKLKSGVKFGKYIVNYGDRANNAETVTKCR